MLYPSYNLMNRLERAEHLIRADILTARIKAHEFELQADELSEQANLLEVARNQLWDEIFRPKKSEDE